ncbi:MAG: COX15/CtaA family protein [Alphaproteobacteria bacterium]|nr:COX15/CtaA family protein [Alphaproteobacteria bacterium]
MNTIVAPNSRRLGIALWLFLTAAAVFIMILIGAITRLTESGLSMVEWKPLIGAIPPLNHEQWQHVFDLYKKTPEFTQKNFWMELSDFKTIFFWEWLHRFWGRLIGLIYALPLLYFWMRGRIPRGYSLLLLSILFLGALQGALGWYMVKSGLIDIPAVSHYRLAAHLGLALLIFMALIWTGFNLVNTHILSRSNPPLFYHGLGVLLSALITITWGAFTAGLDAGLIYNEFPTMGGQWAPPDLWHLSPEWLNFFENPAGVQFLHRCWAFFFLIMVFGWLGHATVRRGAFPALWALGLMIVIQLGLGIATVIHAVPVGLATLHQAGAVIILFLIVLALFQLQPRR